MDKGLARRSRNYATNCDTPQHTRGPTSDVTHDPYTFFNRQKRRLQLPFVKTLRIMKPICFVGVALAPLVALGRSWHPPYTERCLTSSPFELPRPPANNVATVSRLHIDPVEDSTVTISQSPPSLWLNEMQSCQCCSLRAPMLAEPLQPLAQGQLHYWRSSMPK